MNIDTRAVSLSVEENTNGGSEFALVKYLVFRRKMAQEVNTIFDLREKRTKTPVSPRTAVAHSKRCLEFMIGKGLLLWLIVIHNLHTSPTTTSRSR